MKFKLVDDWRNWWKFHSIQASLSGFTLAGYMAWASKAAAVAFSMIGVVKLRYAFLIVAIFPLIAIGFRITKQPIVVESKPDDVKPSA